MKETRHQHHTPRFYLKRWATEGRIWSFDKRTGRISKWGIRRKAGAEEWFYGLPNFPDGWEQHWKILDDGFAEALAEMVDAVYESDAAGIANVSSECDRRLRDFLALQVLRGPKSRNAFEERVHAEVRRELGAVSRVTAKVSGRVVGHEIEHEEEFASELSASLGAVVHAMGLAANLPALLESARNQIFEVARFEQAGLITTDHPVVLTTIDGIKSLLVPLAPDIAMFATPTATLAVGMNSFRVRTASEVNLRIMNRILLNHAHAQAYSRSELTLRDAVDLSFRESPANLEFDGFVVRQPLRSGQQAERVRLEDL